MQGRLSNYPLFEPPLELVERGIRNWSKPEADRYREWLLFVMPERIRSVRRILSLPPSREPDILLNVAGAEMAKLLALPESSRMSSPETANLRGHSITVPAGPQLTPLSYALAADLGLLWADLMVERYPLHWETIRKPKSDVSYNLPVLAGFEHEMNVDPVRVSATLAIGLLDETRTPTAWADVDRWWAAQVQSRS